MLKTPMATAFDLLKSLSEAMWSFRAFSAMISKGWLFQGVVPGYYISRFWREDHPLGGTDLSS